MLADEQRAGRLHINPALMVLAAEGLPTDQYRRIAEAFDIKVGHSYAATECPFLSYSCAHGWYHVNSDWQVLEPVDAQYRPTPPGEQSHTVLVSNLANGIQPILRYGRRAGDPGPAGVRHPGRPHPRPRAVQLVQTTPTTLRVRLRPAAVGAAGFDQRPPVCKQRPMSPSMSAVPVYQQLLRPWSRLPPLAFDSLPVKPPVMRRSVRGTAASQPGARVQESFLATFGVIWPSLLRLPLLSSYRCPECMDQLRCCPRRPV